MGLPAYVRYVYLLKRHFICPCEIGLLSSLLVYSNHFLLPCVKKDLFVHQVSELINLMTFSSVHWHVFLFEFWYMYDVFTSDASTIAAACAFIQSTSSIWKRKQVEHAAQLRHIGLYESRT